MGEDLTEAVVSEFFVGSGGGICVPRIIDSGHEMGSRIARVGGGVSWVADVCAALVSNRCNVMSANGTSLRLIGIIDVRRVRVCDFGNLTDPSRRRRSPRVRGGMAVSILNGSDIPSGGVVTYVGIVPLEIGVIC